MPDQVAADEASRDQIADLEAFEAKFKPENFAGGAHTLCLTDDPETLCCLRSLLLPEFRFFIESCSGAKATREEQVSRLERLRNTATELDGLLGPGGSQSGLPRRLWGSNLISDQFTQTLGVLALEAERQIQRLRSSPQGRAGRPRKETFRQLGADLIRTFEKITRRKAKDLHFDDFYLFAAAACRSLRVAVPAVEAHLPQSVRALRESLLETWKSVVN
jgi:hypothetical protein